MDAETNARCEKIVRFVAVVFVRLSSGITRGGTPMGFSDAIYWSLIPEWVNWVTVADGWCWGWAKKPQYLAGINFWAESEDSNGEYIALPPKDASLEGLWKRPTETKNKADFVLVDNGQVRARLNAQFEAYLTDSALQLTPVQRKLSNVILEAAAGDSQLLQLLTEPASGLSFVLKTLDGFGDEKKRR